MKAGRGGGAGRAGRAERSGPARQAGGTGSTTRAGRAPLVAVALALGLAAVLAACGGTLGSAPVPNPEPFPGIAGQLGRVGVTVRDWRSGDPGCDDASLSPTSIRFEAEGLDQAEPIELRIYIFRGREAWERRLADVDACAAAWATDPETFEIVQISPYVLTGQGPWPAQFEAAIREGLTEAAGDGD